MASKGIIVKKLADMPVTDHWALISYERRQVDDHWGGTDTLHFAEYTAFANKTDLDAQVFNLVMEGKAASVSVMFVQPAKVDIKTSINVEIKPRQRESDYK